MKNKLFTLTAMMAVGISLSGCSASFSTGNGTNANVANTAKPANTASSPAAKTNSNANSTAATADKPKPALVNEKKPEGTANTAKKGVPIPADWIHIYDEKKGYGFSVPAGTTGESENTGGTDVFAATTPSEIDIFVLAYKDKTLTKEDLLKDAVEFLQAMGQKVTPGKLKGESDDFAVADATTVMEDGKKGTLRIMVGTDVSDNYVMVLGTDTDKFAANEKIVDEIWGSFEIWSGGASNN